jgi:hypothetical protein
VALGATTTDVPGPDRPGSSKVTVSNAMLATGTSAPTTAPPCLTSEPARVSTFESSELLPIDVSSPVKYEP